MITRRNYFLEGNKLQNNIRQFHYINEQHLPLIKGIGFGHGSFDYNWDARLRNEQLVVLQVTLKGKGFVEIGGKIWELPKNKAFFSKTPGNYRYFGADWEFLFIEFSETMIQWLDISILVVDLSDAFIDKLRTFIINNKSSEIEISQNAKLAFSLFLDIKDEIKKEIRYKTQLIQAVKEYIDENYFEDIGLEFLSEKFSISKYKMIRQFELAYNTTPIHYLKRVRILHSLSLLWEDKSIEEVAKAVGFSTRNYFSKVFKKNIGISPSNYKSKKRLYTYE